MERQVGLLWNYLQSLDELFASRPRKSWFEANDAVGRGDCGGALEVFEISASSESKGIALPLAAAL
jgi:hypothetical protein